MKILDAQQEEQSVSNSVNWEERETLAYPEDAPILEQLKSYVPAKKRELTRDEIINIKKYYERRGSKGATCKKFDINPVELNAALNSLVGE
jgi:hypothetical protein